MGCPQRLLESETDAYLFFSDCNETDSVIKESVTLAKSKDFKQDKLTDTNTSRTRSSRLKETWRGSRRTGRS